MFIHQAKPRKLGQDRAYMPFVTFKGIRFIMKYEYGLPDNEYITVQASKAGRYSDSLIEKRLRELSNLPEYLTIEQTAMARLFTAKES